MEGVAEDIHGGHAMIVDIIKIKQAVKAGEIEAFVKRGEIFIRNMVGECVKVGEVKPDCQKCFLPSFDL